MIGLSMLCAQISMAIIGRVHKVIAARPAPSPNESRVDAHDAADGDPAIGGIDVHLVPDPGGGMALGVALGADIAGPRQVCQHLRKAHRQLPFQAAQAPTAAPACDASASLPSLRRRLLPRFNRRRIEMCSTRPSIVRAASHADGSQDGSRQTRKRPAKTSLARKPAGTAPAAQPAKPAVNLKTLDQAARRRNVEHRLG